MKYLRGLGNCFYNEFMQTMPFIRNGIAERSKENKKCDRRQEVEFEQFYRNVS